MAEQNFGDVGKDVNIDHAGGDITKAGQDAVGRDKITKITNNYYYPQEKKQPEKPPELPPETKVALINRTEQWDKHIKQRIKGERDRKTFAFAVAAVKEEWPESFKNRLALHFELSLNKVYSLNLDSAFAEVKDWEREFQLELLRCFLRTDSHTDVDEKSDIKKQLMTQLSQSNTPLFFYCLLRPEIAKNQKYIQAIVACWEGLELSNSKKQHVLLIVYGTKEKGFLNFGARAVEKWRKSLLVNLDKLRCPNIVLPALESPDREEVNYWISNQLQDWEQTKFNKKLEKMKGSRIPHLALKDTYIEIVTDKN